MNIFLLLMIFSCSIMQCMDIEQHDINFLFADAPSSKKVARSIVLMFPLLNNMIFDLIGQNSKAEFLNNTVSLKYDIPLQDIPSKIFSKWVSFASAIKIDNGDKSFVFPTDFPLPMINKVKMFIQDELLVDDYAAFINAGDFLEISDVIMHLICDLIVKRILKEQILINFGAIKNTTVQKYCLKLLESIKNGILLHKALFEIKKIRVLTLTNHTMNDHYIFSHNGDYIAYFNRRFNTYHIYMINMKTKAVKGTIQQHALDPSAKNFKVSIMEAAQSSCFGTIHPHDDRLLIHYRDDQQKNRIINLDLGEKGEIKCGALSANAKYAVLGYDMHGEELFNKYTIYDQIGHNKSAVFIQNKLLSPYSCICHPHDDTSGLFKAGESNYQYIPTIANNLIQEPFGQYQKFLENKNLYTLLYNDFGDYIFAVTRDRDENIKFFRLESTNPSQILNELSVPYEYTRTVRFSQVDVNSQGDMAACILNIGTLEHYVYKLFIMNFIENKTYEITGNISSFAFDGYLLAYFERLEDKKQCVVLYDSLHRKELTRYVFPNNDFRQILGFTKRHELVIRTHNGIIFYDVLKKDCWEQIEKSIDGFNFLKSDSLWFKDLLLLQRALNDPLQSSTQDWLNKVPVHFSDDFKRILTECHLINDPMPVHNTLKYAQQVGAHHRWQQFNEQRTHELKKRTRELQQKLSIEQKISDDERLRALPAEQPVAFEQPVQAPQIAPLPAQAHNPPQPPATIIQQIIAGVMATVSAIGSVIMMPFRWIYSWL